MTRFVTRRSLVLVAAVLLGACQAGEAPSGDTARSAPATRPAAAPADPLAAPSETDAIEEATESIANWLLELAVAIKEGRYDDTPAFFADDFRGGALARPAAKAKPVLPGVGEVSWTVPEAAEASFDRAAVPAAFAAWFGRWSRFDHLLFKVKKADVTLGERPSARLRLQVQVVATRKDGGPEELSAWWGAEAVAGPDERHPWLLRAITPEPATSLVAERPMFVEVSRSSGLGKRSPRFGTQGNMGFAWHGAAAFDHDGDGLVDLFVPSHEHNHLYRNRGDGSFEDLAAAAGVALPAGGTGALVLDHDGDGDPDLFVSRVGAPILLENRLVPDGQARFRDVSGESGVGDRPAHGFGAAAADIDGDGDLDVFVASYNSFGDVMPDSWFDARNGTPNLLFRNEGGGRFREVAAASGVAGDRWSYAAGFADHDGDGDQDLHVANDYGPDNFYRNRGDGTFEDVAVDLGLADPGNGMGVAWGDYDNDGDLDLYVMNMSSTAGSRILGRLYPDKREGVAATLVRMAAGNTLFRNRGDGTFEDVSKASGGVGAMWAWGGGFLDIEGDGDEDLYVANGFISGKSMKDT